MISITLRVSVSPWLFAQALGLLLLAGCQVPAAQPEPASLPTAVVLEPTVAQPTAAPSPAPTAAPTFTPMPSPTLAPSPTPDPLAEFILAMRAGFAGDLAANRELPRYDLRMWVDPATGTLTGTAQIVLTNLGNAPLPDVALRLYPNFPTDVFGKGGDVRMQLTAATIDGQPAEPQLLAQATAALLTLPEPLAPGQAASITVDFTATIRPWRDGSWPLPSYYPMLAARDAEGWRLDVTRFADHVFAESALYAAEITIPSELALAASGSTIASRPAGAGRTTWVVRSGPAREFALTLGAFERAEAAGGTNGEVVVNVYTAQGGGLDAEQIARVAAAALADFDTRFGPYPYAELDIQLMPYEYDGGDEFPGLILLYSAGQVGPGTRYVAAHEVAHQWWYGVAGNDIYRQPWLDEALAQYSGIVYAEDVAGAATAAADWEREVRRRYAGALADGDLPIGLAIDDYPSFNVYYRTVYGKGPVFLRALREQLGDAAFFSGLQRYYQSQRYRVGSTRALREAWEAASGQDLRVLFEQWVGSAE